MSYQEKNIAVSLVCYTLVLGYFLTRLSQLHQNGDLNSADLFGLWAVVIVLSIIITIVGAVLMHAGSAIIEVIRTGEEDPKIDDSQDERDKLIDLRGTKVAHLLFSVGVFLAMLTYVFGQPPLVMFALLILSGLAAQALSDIFRLALYRRGF
jgi:hypothetical protein